MKPELEAVALSRATPSLLRGTAILIACIAVGMLVSFHNSVGLPALNSPVGVVLLALVPIAIIVMTMRMKRQMRSAIRTRFESYQITLADDYLVRSVDGYADATLCWDEITRVVDRGENGLVLSPSRAEDSIILFSELEGYAFAKEFALARVPAPSPSVYTANYFFRIGSSLAFSAAFIVGLLSHTRPVVGVCATLVGIYAVYAIRSLKGPNNSRATQRRVRLVFLLAPVLLLLRMIFV